MILPDFILPSRVNQRWQYSGIDSPEYCLDKKYFNSYPHQIQYNYNSRGFRDQEWPVNLKELQKAVWCIGDSFTVGIGSPLEHTWPYQISQQLSKRTINVSMDGASNQWITRKALDIINSISPESIIIQWSYIHRFEIDDTTLSDEDRRLSINPHSFHDTQSLFSDFVKLIQQVELAKNQTKVIHSFVPKFGGGTDIADIWDQICGSDWPPFPINLSEFNSLNSTIVNELINFFKLYDIFKLYYDIYQTIEYVPELQILDRARDGHHYDVLTAEQFAISVGNLLN